MFVGPDSPERRVNGTRSSLTHVPSKGCEPLLTVLTSRVQALLDHIESLEERIDTIERLATGPNVSDESTSTVDAGHVQIDHAARRVYVNGQEIALSPTEYRLMYQLAANAGRVVLHRDLLRRASGNGDASRSNLKVYIGRLRAKIAEVNSPDCDVEAVRGVGYRLVA